MLQDAVSACMQRNGGSVSARAQEVRLQKRTHHDGRVRPLAARHERAYLPRRRQAVHDRHCRRETAHEASQPLILLAATRMYAHALCRSMSTRS